MLPKHFFLKFYHDFSVLHKMLAFRFGFVLLILVSKLQANAVKKRVKADLEA